MDLLRRRFHITESATEVNGKLVTGSTKTDRERSMPIPRFLADRIGANLAGRGDGELAFMTPFRAQFRVGNFRAYWFDPAVKTVGLGKFTPHELRHTAASLAVSAGANVKDVQRMLGHQSAAMTLDIYAGLFEDSLDDVADRLDRLANAAADSLRTDAVITELPNVAKGR